jgi:signal transduction histidine kinase
MVNLIVNACEAMVSGGSIIISEDEIERKGMGRILVITLRDNGPGIPVSIQEKVFQPFFSCKEEGTGLGLTIAERIVTEHGGWLDLQSREGEGAMFIINLPIGKEENEHYINR